MWRIKPRFELEAAQKTGITYSRFTSVEYPQIANAFSLKKDALRGKWDRKPAVPRDERVRAALETAERNRAKAERLEQENPLDSRGSPCPAASGSFATGAAATTSSASSSNGNAPKRPYQPSHPSS